MLPSFQGAAWQTKVHVAGALRYSLDSNSFTCRPGSLSGSRWGGQSTERSCREVPREPLVHARQQQAGSTDTYQVLGKSHKHLSGSCQSRGLGQSALAGWRLLSAGLWWLYSHTQHWQRDRHWGRENGLNVQHFGTCSWGNHCRSKYGFIQGIWPVCRRFSLLWYPEDSSRSETQHGKNGKSSNWSSTLLTETVTCCNEQLRFFFSIN